MFSVVVPTFNRARELARALRSLLSQEGDVSFEIIVVDNNSTDDTRAVVEASEASAKRTPVRYVLEARQGSSYARNAGAAASRGEIIAFVDDDVLVQSGWLRAVAEAYQKYTAAWCMGGRLLLELPSGCPPWLDAGRAVVAAYLSQQDLGEETFRLTPPATLVTANFSVRREALARVGAFRTTLGRVGATLSGDEDTDFCLRVHESGGAIYYCGEAVSLHIVSASRLTKSFFRARAWWEGRSFARLQAQHHYVPHSRSLLAMQLVKDWVKSGLYRVSGEHSRALDHELAGWKSFGYLFEDLVFLKSTRQRKDSAAMLER